MDNTFGFDKLNLLLERTEMLDEELEEVMCYNGEKAINYARANGTYTDRTANLRNSIGYEVAVNGEVTEESTVLSSSAVSPNGDNIGDSGLIEQNIKEAREQFGNFDDDKVSLRVIAGMSYGKYVEDRGYDVITGAYHSIVDSTRASIEKAIQEYKEDIDEVL